MSWDIYHRPGCLRNERLRLSPEVRRKPSAKAVRIDVKQAYPCWLFNLHHRSKLKIHFPPNHSDINQETLKAISMLACHAVALPIKFTGFSVVPLLCVLVGPRNSPLPPDLKTANWVHLGREALGLPRAPIGQSFFSSKLDWGYSKNIEDFPVLIETSNDVSLRSAIETLALEALWVRENRSVYDQEHCLFAQARLCELSFSHLGPPTRWLEYVREIGSCELERKLGEGNRRLGGTHMQLFVGFCYITQNPHDALFNFEVWYNRLRRLQLTRNEQECFFYERLSWLEQFM